jgi:hypothetical protein
MSLDTEKLHRLKGKGFPELYNTHPNKWKEMVDKARDYAQTCVGDGEKVRVGDVATIVQNAIKIDPEFESFVKGKSLTQKYWVTWFAEYLIDQIYPQPDLKPPAPVTPTHN